MSKKFIRTKEDFLCESCGFSVIGDGYTDHCPKCLIGKHVDINPGDRLAECKGLMLPVDYQTKNKGTRIKYRCQKCNHVFWVKMASSDSLEALLSIDR